MKVMKFGGTSVGSPQRIKNVASLISDEKQKFVVLSAMSGTTNSLVEISDYLSKNNPLGANNIIKKLEGIYCKHVDELYSTEEYKQITKRFIIDEFKYLRSLTKQGYSTTREIEILAQGEIISTNMMTNYLKECGKKVCL